MNIKLPTVRLALIICLYILFGCMLMWSGVEARSTCALSCVAKRAGMLREPGTQTGVRGRKSSWKQCLGGLQPLNSSVTTLL